MVWQRLKLTVYDALPLIVVMVGWVAIVACSLTSYRPIPVRPSTISANEFSAERADKILSVLVGDGIPHPADTAQNKIVRQRIVGLLESYGYEVRIQSGRGTARQAVLDRSLGRTHVDLHNIIAVRKGSGSGKAIMLCSHYDSVPAGPGACDDGVGVATTLEIARMLATVPAMQRDVVFLITDGEEIGLAGATLFVDQDELASRIGVVINLESRGTTGPSMMFETSRMSADLIPMFAQTSPKPFSSSLFFEVYKRLDRDTDFSVFNRAGMLGYNFAFIGDAKNYHSPADNLANVDRRSMQHHGENALALIQTLQGFSELDSAVEEAKNGVERECVYFDLFGIWVIHWPSSMSRWLSLLATILFLLAVPSFKNIASAPIIEAANDSKFLFLRRDFAQEFVLVVINGLVGLLTMLAMFITCWLVSFLAKQDVRLSNPWPAQPLLMVSGYWLTGFAVAGGVSLKFAGRLDPRSIWICVCGLGLAGAWATSNWLIGASFLFIVPTLLASFGAVLFGRINRVGLMLTTVVTLLAVGVIWLPLERLFYDAVGFKVLLPTFFRFALVSTTLLCPLSLANSKTRFWFAIVCAIAAVVAFVLAICLSN